MSATSAQIGSARPHRPGGPWSLTVYNSAGANWLQVPADRFSVHLLIHAPEPATLRGFGSPSAIKRTSGFVGWAPGEGIARPRPHMRLAIGTVITAWVSATCLSPTMDWK